MPPVVVGLIFTFALGFNGVISYLLTLAHLPASGWLTSPKTAMNTVVLITVWKFVPFSVLIFLARLQSVPVDIVEAAKCDGANPLQVLRFIVLPWMWPVILVVVMLRVIFSFNEYDIPFLLTQGGPGSSTLVLPLQIRILLLDVQSPGEASAVALAMIGVLVVLALVYFRLYRRNEAALET
jgi:multiple sugar transport system permease protein